MIRTALSLLSPAGSRARLSVLIFHRVMATPDALFPDEPDARRFDTICGWLARWFNVLPLDVAVQRLRDGTLPARAAAITFDDGYADNHDVALPILRRHGLSATFFVATGFLDGGRMWNDTVIECLRRANGPDLDFGWLGLPGIGRLRVGDAAATRAAIGQLLRALKYLPLARRDELVARIAERSGGPLPQQLMMRSEMVRGLRDGGMQIGAHTQTHPILAGLPREQARAEMLGSKHTLEHLVGEPVRSFAYPNGKPDLDYDAASVQLARELGFELAVCTAWGAADRSVDPMQVPRFTPWDRSRLRFGARLAHNLRSPGRTVAPAAPVAEAGAQA